VSVSILYCIQKNKNKQKREEKEMKNLGVAVTRITTKALTSTVILTVLNAII